MKDALRRLIAETLLAAADLLETTAIEIRPKRRRKLKVPAWLSEGKEVRGK